MCCRDFCEKPRETCHWPSRSRKSGNQINMPSRKSGNHIKLMTNSKRAYANYFMGKSESDNKANQRSPFNVRGVHLKKRQTKISLDPSTCNPTNHLRFELPEGLKDWEDEEPPAPLTKAKSQLSIFPWSSDPSMALMADLAWPNSGYSTNA